MEMNPGRYIGCCGAYCSTCKPYVTGFCKGCKLGYDSGGRDISISKCKIKLCCFRDRNLETCADCPEMESCSIIGNLYAQNGYKYKKCRQAVEFIRNNGYGEFIRIAGQWKGAYGKYE